MARRSRDPTPDEGVRESIGAMVRDIRKRREMTLERLSELTGISISSLSRIENTRLGMTIEKVEMLAHALKVSPETLVSRNRRGRGGARAAHPARPGAGAARFMVDRARERHASRDRELNMEYLFDRDTERSLDCLHLTVEAVNIWDSEFVRHPGEKIIYIISGAVVVYCENQSPIVLEKGDSLYMDAYVWHSIVAVNDRQAEVLVTYYHGAIASVAPFETRMFTPERWAGAQSA
jgi:transcriptional regulator with XRE-family HTH domain